MFLIFKSLTLSQRVDLLNTNTSAAFTLMGYSPTEISSPSDLKQFTAALNNATEDLTKLPKNLALELPFSTIVSNEGKFNLRKLSLSLGFVTKVGENGLPGNSRAGLGFKLPICVPDQNKVARINLTNN